MKFERVLSLREKHALRGIVFRDRRIVGIDLAGADLRKARFLNVEIASCNLADTDLRGARFVACRLRDLVLCRARLGLNLFWGTTLTEIGGLSEEQRHAVVESGGMFTGRAVAWSAPASKERTG
jgi:hypothetical protein